MSSVSPHAYPEARALMNRALEAPKGISVNFPTEERAKTAQVACRKLRTSERHRSKQYFSPDDIGYAATPWDSLVISVEGTRLILRNAEAFLSVLDIEEIE